VFFNKSPYSYVPDARPPAVLALYSDNFLGEVRIKPFLNALLKRGVIGDYQVVDRSMTMIGPLKSYRFTHIWCQRNVSTAQFKFLKRHAHVPIFYDVDDLITSVPNFVMRVKHRTRARIEWCLHHAKAVTVATERLGMSLQEDVPSLPAQVVVLRNGCLNATPPERREPQKQVVWTSGDLPFFLDGSPNFTGRSCGVVNRAGYVRAARSLRQQACGEVRTKPADFVSRFRIVPRVPALLRRSDRHRSAAVKPATGVAAFFRCQVGHQARRLPVLRNHPGVQQRGSLRQIQPVSAGAGRVRCK
jgi:hypothetical protein